MNWFISIPTWGDHFVGHLLTTCIPSIVASLQQADHSAEFIIHTDKPDERELQIRTALPDGLKLTLRLVPEGDGKHSTLGAAHRDVLNSALVGSPIVFINADHVCSINLFQALGRRLADGKKLIMAMGIRTLEDPHDRPPVGVGSRELLEWGWARPHSWTTHCRWGTGRTRAPSVLFFDQPDGSVIMHGFHLHPLLVVKKDESITFEKATIDDDLGAKFSFPETHIVTDPDELSMVEMSPSSYDLGTVPEPINIPDVVRWAKRATNDKHRWQFAHRIIIKGSGYNMDDQDICEKILSSLRVLDKNPFAGFIQDNRIMDTDPMFDAPYLSRERRELLKMQAQIRTKDETLKDDAQYIIALPIWGKLFTEIATKYTLPALRIALERVPHRRPHCIVYTDDAEALRPHLEGISADFRDVPAAPDAEYRHLFKTRDIHRQVISETPNGNVTILLNGDHIVSRELFSVVEGVIAMGRKVLMSPSPRSVIADEPPPIGGSARELMDWAWRNRHPIVERAVWSRGTTNFPNTLFFEDGENVVMHGFQVHPVALVKGRSLKYTGTIDDDLIFNYANEEISWMENPDAAITDASLGHPDSGVVDPTDKGSARDTNQYGVGQRLTVNYVASWAHIMSDLHIRTFKRCFRLCGSGHVNSQVIVDEIIKTMRGPN